MYGAPTQHRGTRGVTFAPLAQAEATDASALDESSEEVQQRWENLTAKERFRNQIQDILRHSSTIEDYEDENDLHQVQEVRSGHAAAYVPVGDLIPNPGFEERDIAELSGSYGGYYAPTYERPPYEKRPPYDRAPSSLSKASDSRTETTYMGSEPGDKFLHYAPKITSVEVDGQSDESQPPTERPNYKPFVLKGPFLAVLFLVIVILMALTEAAVHVLPDATKGSEALLSTRNSTRVKVRDLWAERQSSHLLHGLHYPRDDDITGDGVSDGDKGSGDTKPNPVRTTSSTITTEEKSSTTSSTSTTSLDSVASTSTKSDPKQPQVTSTAEDTAPTTTKTQQSLTSTTTSQVLSSENGPKPSENDSPKPTNDPRPSDVTMTTNKPLPSTTQPNPQQPGGSTGGESGPTNENSHPTGGKTNPPGGGADRTSTSSQPDKQPHPTEANPSTTGTDPTPPDNGPTPPQTHTLPGEITTAPPPFPPILSTTSTSEKEPTHTDGGHGDIPGPSSTTTTSQQAPGPPQQSTERTLRTCFVSVTQVFTQWTTVPAVTVNVGVLEIGVNKRSVSPTQVKLVPRQDPNCDVVVTATVYSTIVLTTTSTILSVGIPDKPSTTPPVPDPGGSTEKQTTSSDTGVPSITNSITVTTSTSTSVSQPSEPASQPDGPTEKPSTVTSSAQVTTSDPPNPGGISSTSSTSKASDPVVPPSSSSTASLTQSSDTTIHPPLPPGSSTDQISATNSEVSSDVSLTTTRATQTNVPSQVAETTTIKPPQEDGVTRSTQERLTITTIPQMPKSTVITTVEISTVVQIVTSTISTSATDRDAPGGIFIMTRSMTSKFYNTKVKTVELATTDGVATTLVLTQTDENGVLTTATETMFAYLTTSTGTDSNGRPETKVLEVLKRPSRSTFTDSQGRLTTKTYQTTLSTTTRTDRYGRPTLTEILDITETPSVMTLYDENHIATATITKMVADGTSTSTVIAVATSTMTGNASSASAGHKEPIKLPMTSSQYFSSVLLPIFLAIALSIAVRILDQNAKLYQPFFALTLPYGARTADSLCLNTTGMWGLVSGILSPLTGNVLLVVTGLLVLTSSLLIALSTEAVRVVSDCSGGSDVPCPAALSVVPGTAQAIVGLFCFMALLLAIAGFALWGRQTGIWNNRPWSMFDIGRLALNGSTLALLKRMRPKNGKIKNGDAIRAFGNRRFGLGYWKAGNDWQYGIMIMNDAGSLLDKNRGIEFKEGGKWSVRKKSMPFFTLSLAGRSLFLLLLMSLVLIILLNNNTGVNYQTFMDDASFGGRFLLTAVGVVISLSWWTFFSCIAYLSPYRLLYRNRGAKEAIYLSAPTNPYAGFWRVTTRQHPDTYLGVVAFTAILSDILPILLANIPSIGLSDGGASTASTWFSVSILCIMIVVIIWSFLLSWPPMPIDPSTIAGAMYYATDPSKFLNGVRTSGRSSPV
ncbi:hypothetical protein JX266_002111 [Neoarthrinium moseri]|nr:hypothetical protein JX266_002111 [Neoarthrinium moseri]